MTLEFAQRLTQLRKERGYSQEELAWKLGVSRQAVSKWERAEASPDTDNLIALARLYGVSLDELVFKPAPSGIMDIPHTSTADMMNDPDELPPTMPAQAFVQDIGSTVPAEDMPDTEFDADPLPEGSYYEAKRRHEEKEKHARRQRFPYPVVITFVYLALGLLLNLWHPGWILYLTIPLFYLRPEDRTFRRLLGNPVLLTIVYLLMGILWGWWHPGWMIYLLIPVMHAWR